MFNDEYRNTFSQVTAPQETYEKVMQMTQKRKPRRIRGLAGKVLLAAVFLSGLAITASAAGRVQNWFVDYFSSFRQEALSEGQVSFLEEHTRTIAMGQTIDGYTLTVDSAIADGYQAYLTVTVTAPKDVVLDAELYYLGWNNEPEEDFAVELLQGRKNRAWMSGQLPLKDENPRDNRKQFLLSFSLMEQGKTTFAEGSWTLHAAQFTQPQEKGALILSDASWEIPVAFTAKTNWLELDTHSAVVSLQQNYPQEEPVYKPYRLTLLKISALSAQMNYEYVESAAQASQHIPPGLDYLEAHLKSGEIIRLNFIGNSSRNRTIQFRSDAPIILDELSYVQLPDGTRFDPKPTGLDLSVSLHSFMTDGQAAYVTLNVEEPENIPAPGPGWTLDQGLSFSNIWFCPSEQQQATMEDIISSNISLRRLEDGDGKDHTYKLVLSLSRDGQEALFAPGSKWKLHLAGLECNWIHQERYDALVNGRETYMLDGEVLRDVMKTERVSVDTWDFYLEFTGGEQRELELVTQPLTLTGTRTATIAELQKDPQRPDIGPVKAQLISFKISPLTYSIEYSAEDPLNAQSFNPGMYQLVMKDGRTMALFPYSGTKNFEEPVLLEDADYVLCPDGTRLMILE